MESALLYFGKVIVCSGVTFLYYQLSLKDKTFHHYNRFYLLAAMLISLLLPMIKVEDFTVEVNNDLYLLIDKIQNFNTTKTIDNDHIYLRIIFSALGLVSLYFLGKLLYGMIRIQQLKNEYHKETFDGINFYQTNLSEAPFSYFRNLFWKNSIQLNSEVGKQILKHEMVHIEQKHSFDKIFIEIITSVFWFNPFFHIIKKEINLIHEYLADKKAVKQSDTKAFAQMLLASHFSGTQLPATSPFLSSNLKKRLKMLQKPKTKFGYARRIFALPVVFSVAFAYLVNAKNWEIKETNIEIEKAVSEISHQPVQKDTLTPKLKGNAVLTPKHKNEDDNKKIAELSKKIEEKSKALQSMKPNSKEFEQNIGEIAALSGEIGKMAVSQDFMKSAMIIRMDGKDVHVNEYFKSREWKDKVKKLEDINIEIPEMPEMDFDFPETPALPNAPEVQVYKFNKSPDMKWTADADVVFRSAAKGKEFGATARKRAEITRKRAKLDEKRAKLEGERAKLEAERRALDGNSRMYVYSNSFNTVRPRKINDVRINAMSSTSKIDGEQLKKYSAHIDDIKYYRDGKEIDKKEFESLDPDKINSINITTNSTDGKKSGQIRIETKN